MGPHGGYLLEDLTWAAHASVLSFFRPWLWLDRTTSTTLSSSSEKAPHAHPRAANTCFAALSSVRACSPPCSSSRLRLALSMKLVAWSPLMPLATLPPVRARSGTVIPKTPLMVMPSLGFPICRKSLRNCTTKSKKPKTQSCRVFWGAAVSAVTAIVSMTKERTWAVAGSEVAPENWSS